MTTTVDYTIIERELAENTKTGTVTLALIGAAIDSIHPDGYEGIPYSQGLSWIYRHTQVFLELLEEAGVTVDEFFRPYLKSFHLADHFLNNEWLLLALGDEQRVPFVRDVFLAAGDIYDNWLKTALRVGIGKNELAEMILEKLRRTTVELKYNVSNFMRHAFMENGAGRVRRHYNGGPAYFEETDTYWDVLTDDQLVEAMKIVATTTPNLLFCGRGFNEPFRTCDKLQIRLGDSKVAALLEFAAENLESLTLVSLDTLAELPMDVQIKLARRLKVPFGQWVIQMALKMGGLNGGLALLSEFKEERLADFVATFKWWRNLDKRSDPSSLHQEVDQRLLAGLMASGWQVGLLRTGTHRGRSQYFVALNGRKYVMDGHQHDYGTHGDQTRKYPHEGDTVMFCPANGFQLVPGKVWAVFFTLVSPAKK